MSYSPHEAFLTNDERSEIQRMFEKWNNTLKPGRIIGTLYAEDLIRGREKQEYEIKRTEYDKCEFLYETCLMRATYSQIKKVRKVLVQSNEHAHRILAEQLPVRPHDDYWDQLKYDEEQEQLSKLPNPDLQKESKPYQATLAAPPKHAKQETGQHEKPMETEDYKREKIHDCRNSAAGHTAQAAAQHDRSQMQPQMHQGPATQGLNQQLLPQGLLRCYETINKNNPKGNGYVLVIHNYTNDPTVQSYQRDVDRIFQFFQGNLKYDIQVERNKSRQECINLFTDVKRHLLQNHYDRFLLFFLSHGDDIGIKCTTDGVNDEMGDYNDEHDPNRPTHLRIDEDIVRNFTHDVVPTLRGFPKIFFIQACAGEQIARAAGNSESNICRPAARSEKLTIGADTLVCQASQKDHFAWVDNNGSWLVQETINIFEQFYEREHLLDMLTEVNNRISGKAMAGMAGGAYHPEVWQLPFVSHNLTKKLYFNRNQ